MAFVFAHEEKRVVNCFQILYIRSLNTINNPTTVNVTKL